MEPVSFDRAARYYDRTRALPGQVLETITAMLAGELLVRGPCLEIGVGTGRIALPLSARGVRMTGADISDAMLRRLVANAGDTIPFPLLLADATRLPLAADLFGGVVACHVLHLIPDWRAAVDETMRVLRPGGVLLADFGAICNGDPLPGGPPWTSAVNQILIGHGIRWEHPGTTDPAAVTAHLGDRAESWQLPAVPVAYTSTLREMVENFEQQIYSWTWRFPADVIQDACTQIRDWAQREGVDLDERTQGTHVITWRAFRRLR